MRLRSNQIAQPRNVADARESPAYLQASRGLASRPTDRAAEAVISTTCSRILPRGTGGHVFLIHTAVTNVEFAGPGYPRRRDSPKRALPQTAMPRHARRRRFPRRRAIMESVFCIFVKEVSLMSGKFGLSIVVLAVAVLMAAENQSLAGRRKGCASCSAGGCSTGACPTTACESGACPAPAPAAPAEKTEKAAGVPAAPESTPAVTSAPAVERGYAVSRRGARRGWRR